MQTTLQTPVSITGIGLHTGSFARVTLKGAAAGTGIVFRRVDITDRDPRIPALWDRVAQLPLNTRIVNADGVAVSTIEHLMAALAGTGL
ncbi:MAG TPA: UDP-3-O-acyl-N-acetylglucosamine deacetylase, partial [Rubellimicrobium sp.]|nr:UDP-3-O-acyl-N-acetylglucosamine deacetylase [Rubellimicrobium sp.]